MESLIKNIKMFAEQNFPVEEVSSYLFNLDIPREKLEKYCHFNNGFYTRNLVHTSKQLIFRNPVPYVQGFAYRTRY